MSFSGSPATPKPPVRVLIVEDESVSRRALGRLLQTYGYRVKLAESAERAMQILDHEDWPDVVLLDVNLPGMKGDKFVEKLHQMAPEVIVVLVTSEERSSLPVVAKGLVNYIRKPVDPDHLLSVLEDSGGYGQSA